MSDGHNLVIVGAGLAGAKAAEGARGLGFEGRVLLIGEEQGLPYEKPPLSKNVLRGDDAPDAANVNDEEFYKSHDIELVHGRVVSLDINSHSLRIAGDSNEITFGSVVLATGSSPRKLTLPGADLDGVHYLRTRDDSIHLRESIRASTRVCVIGGGWIGSEVAASAKQMGADVVIADSGPVLLGRVMGKAIGDAFQHLHAENGVIVRNNVTVTELRGNGKVEGVALSDGSVEEADLVVAGIGAVPRTELAESSGLNLDLGGVAADEYLCAADGVYVAGDIAAAIHPFYGRRLRVEHWDTALNQGKRAGENVAGAKKAYRKIPYFYTDQFDLGMEYVGVADPDASVVIRGDLDKREFIVFWHKSGVVTSAMNVNIWDVVEDLKKVITSKSPVDEARFADTDIPVSDLV